MSLLIEPIPLEGHPLSDAYIREHSTVARLYLSGAPSDADSYETVLERLRESRPRSYWESLPEAFERAGTSTRQRIARVVENRGAFVIAGQQAGLFTGPLLTIYKALSAVRTAAVLEERLGVPIVPLFWVASEDHDWDEVNNAHVVDLENRLRRIRVEREAGDGAGPGRAIYRVRLGSDIETALDEMAEATPDTEFKADVLGPLREAYRPGRGFADAFQVALDDLLERLGLVTIQASHPWVKTRSREILRREWASRRDSSDLVLERGREIEAMGFPLRVEVAGTATNLFVEGPVGRDRLMLDGDGAVLRAAGTAFTEAEMERLLADETGRVSAGVLLGTVVQAGVLPTIAHVVGPSEIAYAAQTQPLFQLHEVPAPVLVPRASIRLVEARVEKVLEKYGIEADDVGSDGEEWIERRTRAETPVELSEAVSALRKSVAEALDRVEAAANAFDPGSRSAVGSGRKSLFDGITELEKKLQARVREKHQVMRRQLQKAAVHLYPGGRPQERVLNTYPYLVRYGRQLIDDLYERIETPPK